MTQKHSRVWERNRRRTAVLAFNDESVRYTSFHHVTSQVVINVCSGTHRYELVSTAKLSAHVGRTSRQNERDEDSFAVFTTHDVEAQSGSAFAQQNLASLPETKKYSINTNAQLNTEGGHYRPLTDTWFVWEHDTTDTNME